MIVVVVGVYDVDLGGDDGAGDNDDGDVDDDNDDAVDNVYMQEMRCCHDTRGLTSDSCSWWVTLRPRTLGR